MTRTVPNHAYKILGASPRDDFATIRKKWRALARANHPDVASGCPEEATRKFAAINDAYDALRFHRQSPDPDAVAREARAKAREREARRRAREEMMRQAREAERLAQERARMRAEQEAHDAALRAARQVGAQDKPAQERDARARRGTTLPMFVGRLSETCRTARDGYRSLSAMTALRRPKVDLNA